MLVPLDGPSEGVFAIHKMHLHTFCYIQCVDFARNTNILFIILSEPSGYGLIAISLTSVAI